MLALNGLGLTPAGWHDCSETNGHDPPLLVAFFLIGSAICALISLDRHSGADSGAIDRDPLEIKPPHSTGVELLPGLTVESGHTVAGLVRDP